MALPTAEVLLSVKMNLLFMPAAQFISTRPSTHLLPLSASLAAVHDTRLPIEFPKSTAPLPLPATCSTKSSTCRDHRSMLYVTPRGFSLPPDPSRSIPYTGCPAAASASYWFRHVSADDPNPWMSTAGGLEPPVPALAYRIWYPSHVHCSVFSAPSTGLIRFSMAVCSITGDDMRRAAALPPVCLDAAAGARWWAGSAALLRSATGQKVGVLNAREEATSIAQTPILIIVIVPASLSMRHRNKCAP
mmetsp:Transcript_40077/g.78510  ORF Transcript_40077/g.78510 Transcript_40077/m.78510 type:complete len:246 (+) Transcript_40077:670-1407(+)